MPELVIYYRSPSVVVDDDATFIDLEHNLEFTVDEYVHGLFQCGSKVHLDAEITFSYKMETATVATVGLDRSRRRCSLCQSHHKTTRSLRPVLVYQWREKVDVASNVAAGLEV